MMQKTHFLHSLGDAWFDRNHTELGKRDPVTDLIEHHKMNPHMVLEIGCANGWRLIKLAAKYGCVIRLEFEVPEAHANLFHGVNSVAPIASFIATEARKGQFRGAIPAAAGQDPAKPKPPRR